MSTVNQGFGWQAEFSEDTNLFKVFKADTSEACCGENRTNWIKVGEVHMDELMESLMFPKAYFERMINAYKD